MKLLIIVILLLTALFANCQTDSIWVDGDNVCMNKEKAIQFAKMKDSLIFLKKDLEIRESLLLDCDVLVKSSQKTIEGLQKECSILAQKIGEIESKLGIQEERLVLKENELKSVVILAQKNEKERKQFEIQRDILIGAGASLVVTVIVLIIVNSI